MLIAESKAPARRDAADLLQNSGFEELEAGDLAGWQIAGAPVIDASGQYSAGGRVALRSEAVRDVVYQTVKVVPERPYLLGCEIRAEAPGREAKLQVNWYDAQGNLLKEDVAILKAEAGWRRREKKLPAPPRTALAVVYASALDQSSIWFDDFSFGKIRYRPAP